MTNKKEEKVSFYHFLSFLYILLILPVALLISVIGTKTGRLRRGVLQIPVYFYKHKNTSKRVVLVGTIHIGKPSYYKKIQDLIDSMVEEGYLVLYESIGKMSNEEISRLPEKQKYFAKWIKNIDFGINELLNFFGDETIHQRQGLRYPPSWIRTDLDLSHICSLFAETKTEFDENPKDDFLKIKDESGCTDDFLKIAFRTIIKIIPGLSIVFKIIHRDKNKIARDKIFIKERDEIAFKAIIEHNKQSNILSIWGAYHLPGIHKHLLTAGYNRTNIKWFDAF